MLQQVAKSAVLLMLMTTADAYGLQKNQAAANNNNNNHRSDVLSRRELGAQTLRNLVAGTAVASTLTSSPDAALATDDDVDVYFGVGCFWHIQHEVRLFGLLVFSINRHTWLVSFLLYLYSPTYTRNPTFSNTGAIF